MTEDRDVVKRPDSRRDEQPCVSGISSGNRCRLFPLPAASTRAVRYGQEAGFTPESVHHDGHFL